jgi:hypothetical protein
MDLNKIARELLAEKQAAKAHRQAVELPDLSSAKRMQAVSSEPAAAPYSASEGESKVCALKSCGKTFYRPRYANGKLLPGPTWRAQQYCSTACYGIARRGVKRGPLPNPRRKQEPNRYSAYQAGPNSTAHPHLLNAERASGVKQRVPTKRELKEALGKALKQHPDLLEAFELCALQSIASGFESAPYHGEAAA